MTTSVHNLLSMLDITPQGMNSYVGHSPSSPRPRLFGGQVLGQALAAAGRTVARGRAPHSLHAYFLKPGAAGIPVEYTVATIRESRGFSTRRISAHQGCRHIFEMTASFQNPENGVDHQFPMPTTSGPDMARPILDDFENEPDIYREWGSVDLRRVPRTEPIRGRAHSQVWMRTRQTVPADPLLSACILACLSDLTLLSVALVPHGISMRHEEYLVASLDHSIWFHRPFHVDAWLLYDQFSPSATNGLALTNGHFYQQDGSLVATVAQEGAIRELR